MLRLVPLLLFVAGVSCDHRTPEASSAPPTTQKGEENTSSGHEPQTHWAIVSARQAWSFTFDLSPELRDTVGLRFEMRGRCGIARVSVDGARSHVGTSLPQTNADGLLDQPAHNVEVYWENPLPAGNRITGSVDFLFLPCPMVEFPIGVTPLLLRDPAATPIAAASGEHHYARYLHLTRDLGSFAEPQNGLEEGVRYHTPDKGWVNSRQYRLHGWTLTHVPHEDVVIPIDVPSAEGFVVKDILAVGVGAICLEVSGFRIASLSVDTQDIGIADISGDAELHCEPDPRMDVAQKIACTAERGLTQVTIRLSQPVDADASGLFTFTIKPMSDDVALKGLMRFSYVVNGDGR